MTARPFGAPGGKPLAPESQQLYNALAQSGFLKIQTINDWMRADGGGSSLEESLFRHSAEYGESAWLEWIADLREQSGLSGLPVYPVSHKDGVCATALTAGGSRLMSDHQAAILDDGAVILVGLLNPFAHDRVYKEVAALCTVNSPRLAFCLITPHHLAYYAALLNSNQLRAPWQWAENEISEWCDRLGFAADEYQGGIKSVVESLWCDQPQVPPAPYGSVPAGNSLLPGESAYLMASTSRHAWVAVDNAFGEELVDSLYQVLRGKKVHLFALPPGERKRLQTAGSSGNSPGFQSAADDPSMVVRDWPSMEQDSVGLLWKHILDAAIARGASDIHFSPKASLVRVRFRLNGVLVDQAALKTGVYREVVRAMKAYSGMRQDYTDQMQDGSCSHHYRGLVYDQRFSIAITHGTREKTVVRILTPYLPELAKLGLSPREYDTLRWFLGLDAGMMITTGPTGSGKTSTLYACLNYLNDPRYSIFTIENPVEKVVEDFDQVNVDPKSGLTMSNCLATAMRQDPDIIMVGEIRDHETAVVAVEAASSGHLLLTTMHTNDCAEVISRLEGPFLGIDRGALVASLKLVVSQRLVPRLCPVCKKLREVRSAEIAHFPTVSNLQRPMIGEPVGCPHCKGTGYAGRLVLMEMLPVDKQIAGLLESGASAEAIRKENRARGFDGLSIQATRQMYAGEIDLTAARGFLDVLVGT